MAQGYPQYAAQKLLTQRAVERTPRRGSESTERWFREKAEKEKRDHDRRVKYYFAPRPNGAFIPDWEEPRFDEGPLSPPIRNRSRSRSRSRRDRPSRSSTQSSGAALRVGFAQQQYDDSDPFNGNGLSSTRDRPPTPFFGEAQNTRAETYSRPSSRSTTAFWPSPALSGDGSVPAWFTNGRTRHDSPGFMPRPTSTSHSRSTSRSSNAFWPSPTPSEFGAPLRRFDNGRTRYDSPDFLGRADSARGSGRSSRQSTRPEGMTPADLLLRGDQSRGRSHSRYRTIGNGSRSASSSRSRSRSHHRSTRRNADERTWAHHDLPDRTRGRSQSRHSPEREDPIYGVGWSRNEAIRRSAEDRDRRPNGQRWERRNAVSYH
ncbi:hypothetical protein HII31_04823 [Pseudocercospora fuligena]|uniref:Uncharacterized protein n=1 Tax=Pseudocercospora fuligena TaxID=685502 RepID=A0A8H6VIQ5_9PEZI|nr:hypothetical protein HII31_04823 [Pseudocercospora fuligena]